MVNKEHTADQASSLSAEQSDLLLKSGVVMGPDTARGRDPGYANALLGKTSHWDQVGS